MSSKRSREVQPSRQQDSSRLKGKKGGHCNLTACQKPGAYYYNHGSMAYYCESCAHMLNRVNTRDSFVIALGHPLCTLDPDFVDLISG